jgi:hypothetical protein
MRFMTSSQCYAAVVGALVLLLGVNLWQEPPKLVSDRVQPEDAIETQSKRLQQYKQERESFVQYVDGVVDELARGKLELCMAVERVYGYCLEKYPLYLNYLEFSHHGRTIRERIAQNLVYDIQGTMENGNTKGWPADTVQRLETELARVLAYAKSGA